MKKKANDVPRILIFDFNLPYLICDSNYPVGGVTVELLAWIHGLQHQGYEVGLLTWKGAANLINASKNVNFQIVECYNPQKGVPKLRWIYYRLPSILSSVKKFNPDVIFQESATGYTGIFGIIAKILGKKFLFRPASDKDVDERIRDKLSVSELFFFKLGYKLASFYCCQNNYQLAKIKERYNNKNAFVLHNPFVVKKRLNLNNKSRDYVSWIGNFRTEKNIPELLNVVKANPNLKFKIAGSITSYMTNDIKKTISNLKLQKNVEFVGYLKRDKILSFLENSKVLLNTSILEGFSNTFLEAWSVGTPVVTTKNVNPDNIIEKYGLGVVASDYHILSTLLFKLYYSDDYDNYFNRCISYVVKYHDPAKLAQKLIENIL